MIIETIFLVLTLTLDTVIASFAYGLEKIKIPFISAIILTTISTLLFGMSLGVGNIIKPFLSNELIKWFCFSILLILGISKFLDGIFKQWIQKNNNLQKEVVFHIFCFSFILKVLADPTKADYDLSHSLSIKEAIYLGFTLSLDGIGIGIGAGIALISIPLAVILSFLINLFIIYIGYFFGRKAKDNLPLDISWIGGIILVVLAIIKVL